MPNSGDTKRSNHGGNDHDRYFVRVRDFDCNIMPYYLHLISSAALAPPILDCVLDFEQNVEVFYEIFGANVYAHTSTIGNQSPYI